MGKLVSLALILFLSGCASSLENVRVEKVTLCENQRCRYLTDVDSKEELLIKIFNLLKEAEDKDSDFFESSPENRTFEKKGIGFFVLGVPALPGLATWSSVKFTDVLYIDRENMEIKFKARDKATWNATPLFITSADGVLAIKSMTEIKVNYSAFGTWLVMPWGSQTEWLIDYIDLDNKVLGSHYAISVAGTGVGRGSGYQLVKLADKLIEKKVLGVVIPNDASQTVKIKQPIPSSTAAVVSDSPKIIPPVLFTTVMFTETSGNRILEGGEEIILRVEVENKGEGVAKDVQIVLAENQMLVGYLGGRKSLGDIKAKEKKTAEFKALLPPQIPSGDADLKIEITEAQGFSPSETKVLKIATRQTEKKETVEVISEIPRLVFTSHLRDQNNNRVLDGDEEVSLKVAVENKGEGVAKDVHVVLSGNKILTEYFGEKKFIGDIRPGEKKTVEFKAILPARIPSESAVLKISLKDAQELSSSEVKILKVAMRPKEIKEVVEVISEVNVDDIPLKTKNYEKKGTFALVMGISKYREESIPTVKYASRDAEIMAKYLENIGGIPKSNIKVLTDASVAKSDLEAYIEDWLVRRVDKDSTVFVYYAGHGVPDPESKEAYIVPYEGHPDFPSKLYSLKKMYESLNKLPAKEIIVMLDSCFSGSGGRSITKSGARPLVISMENPVLAGGKINVLAASTGSQISSDYDSAKHGLFTYYLLRGMRGEADGNGNGFVELLELYDYVKTNVAEKASLELNRDQTPVLLPSIDSADNRLKTPVAKIK